MTIIQKIFFFFFLFFFLIIPVWKFFIAPQFQMFPKNFSEEILYNGQIAFLDLETGKANPVAVTESVSVETALFSEKTLVLKTHIKTFDINKGIVFKADVTHNVDRKTKKHLDMENQGSYFRFPSHVEERNYMLKDELFFSVGEMVFAGVDTVEGLNVFIFNYTIPPVDISQIAYTASPYLDNGNIYSTLEGVLWVEPVTGKIVKRIHNWEDCYFETMNCVNIGKTFYSDDTIAKQVRIAQNEKQQIILVDRWIPILFGLIALAFLVVLFASRRVILRDE